MSAGESSEEKNFEPTESRIERARREGDAAQSREANAAGAYIGFYVAFLASGAVATAIARPLSGLLQHPEDYAAVFLKPGDQTGAFIIAISAASAAFLFTPGLGALLSIIAQRAFTFAPSKLAIKFSRISPTSNAKQKFGPQGIAEFFKGVLKLFFVMAAFGVLFMTGLERWPAYARAPGGAALDLMQKESAIFIGLISLFAVFVAAIDLPWQRWRYRKKLMMSFDELKRESKETDGNPAMKQSRRQRAKAIATNRMLSDVPNANVVITNPTHYAVALKWDGPKSGAPICVAKGADEMAAKIREIAERSKVPIRSDAPTARAIYSVVDVGEEIQPSHYAAIAAAIIYADKVRSAARHS